MQTYPDIFAAALAATFIFPIGSVTAAPVFLPEAPNAQPDVIQVQQGARWRRNVRRGNSPGWHNGYRGYRYHRRGYREYNGFWFPGGAFMAGVIIGSAISNGNNFYGPYDDYQGGYYGRTYYPNRYYDDYYRNANTCSPRMEDAGKCRGFSSRNYGNYDRRAIIIDR